MAGSASAANADVLAVGAVGPSPDPVSTVQQGRLRSFAVDVVQEDQADALAEGPVCDDLSVTSEDGEDVRGTSCCCYVITIIIFC